MKLIKYILHEHNHDNDTNTIRTDSATSLTSLILTYLWYSFDHISTCTSELCCGSRISSFIVLSVCVIKVPLFTIRHRHIHLTPKHVGLM